MKNPVVLSSFLGEHPTCLYPTYIAFIPVGKGWWMATSISLTDLSLLCACTCLFFLQLPLPALPAKWGTRWAELCQNFPKETFGSNWRPWNMGADEGPDSWPCSSWLTERNCDALSPCCPLLYNHASVGMSEQGACCSVIPWIAELSLGKMISDLWLISEYPYSTLGL